MLGVYFCNRIVGVAAALCCSCCSLELVLIKNVPLVAPLPLTACLQVLYRWPWMSSPCPDFKKTLSLLQDPPSTRELHCNCGSGHWTFCRIWPEDYCLLWCSRLWQYIQYKTVHKNSLYAIVYIWHWVAFVSNPKITFCAWYVCSQLLFLFGRFFTCTFEILSKDIHHMKLYTLPNNGYIFQWIN